MANPALIAAITQALSKQTGGPSAVAVDIATGIESYLQPLLSGLLIPGAFGSPMGPCFPGAITAPVTAMLNSPPPAVQNSQTSDPDQLKRQIIIEVFRLLEENYVITLREGATSPRNP